LFRLRTGLGIVGLLPLKNIRHGIGQDHVADFNRWIESRGEGTQINDPLIRIQSLESRNGTAEVAKFAVIIIFDDDAVVFSCPGQQLISSADGNHRSCGELIGGIYIDCRGSSGRQIFNPDAGLIHRNLDKMEAPIPETVFYRQIAGILQDYPKHGELPQDDRQLSGNLLGAGSDDNLGRLANHASGLINVFGYFPSKSRLSLGIPLEKQEAGMLRQDLIHAFFPFVEVKGSRVVKVGILQFGKRVLPSAEWISGKSGTGRYLADEIAGALTAGYVSFHLKLIIGKTDGGDADAQIF
jgi:hypothetical protein